MLPVISTEMDIRKHRGRPRKQQLSRIISDPDQSSKDLESSDDLEQYKQFKCKNFEINLSLDNPFLDSSYLKTGEMEIEITKIRPIVSIRKEDAWKRRSFPLQPRKKLGCISSRRSLRLNNNETADINELKVDAANTKNNDVEIEVETNTTSTTDGEEMKSEGKHDEPLAVHEDQNKTQNDNPPHSGETGGCNDEITEQKSNAIEKMETSKEHSITMHEDIASTACCDKIMTSNSVGNVKTEVDSLAVFALSPEVPVSTVAGNQTTVEPEKPIGCEASTDLSEISPRRKMGEVLRQLETTLNPKMTDLPTNTQDNVKVSRFGRHQKMKSGFDDFIPVDLTRFINVSPSKHKKTVTTKLPDEVKSMLLTKEAAVSVPLLSPNKNEIQLSGQDEDYPQAMKIPKCDVTPVPLLSSTTNEIQPTSQDEDLSHASNGQILSDTDAAFGSSVDQVTTKLSIGDILWGSVANSVFWPCIVCPDPDSGQAIISKLESSARGRTGKSNLLVHVRFFSDNGRRSWLKTQKTLEFSGIEDLDTKLLDTATWDKKQKRLPTDSQRPFWKSAIMQAQEFITYDKPERYGIYLQLLEKERLERIEQNKLKRNSISTRISAENLLKLQSERGRKRSRSSSPDSPAFEVLTAEGIKQEVEEDQFRSSCIDRFFKSIEPQSKIRQPPKKKIRLNNGDASQMSQDKKIEITDEIDNDNLFQQFFEGLKATVLTSNSPDLIAELKLYAKRIWLLKIFDAKQADSENLSKIGKHLNRKLSLRKQSSSSRRSSATTTTESTAPMKKSNSNETVAVTKATKTPPNKKEALSLKEMFLSELEKNYLFKSMTREPVCPLCRKIGGLVQCSGECGNFFHPICCIKKKDCENENSEYEILMRDISPNNVAKLENSVKLEPIEMDVVQEIKASAANSIQFQCNECSGNKPHQCFICQLNPESAGVTEDTIKCSVTGCGKFFHHSCLKIFPQAIIDDSPTLKRLFCPQHCCHTCVSDDPKQKTNRKDNKPPLIKCVACPSSYHFDSGCVPAGSEFLTASRIICSKHSVNVERKSSLNINWCFICSLGGTLLCCEQCPASFHQECLDIKMPIQGRYICEVCEAGRMPLYNDIIWAKYSHHRWWPALILPPPVVPEIMLKQQHSDFDFCIRFFGSHDFCWIKRERVFLYQDGDSDSLKKSDKPVYNRALIEAKEIFDFLQEQKKNEPNDPNRFDNRPPFYRRIKCNQPVPPVKLNGSEDQDIHDDVCDCSPTDEQPCGLSSNCINRTLNQECDPTTCPAGLKCCNQSFKNRLYPKMKVKRTPGRGWGLDTLEEIKAGTFVIEYVGELIDSSELEYRLKKKADQNDENYYFLTINANLIIDAGPKGNLSRFMNHSCDPNCQTQKWTVGGQTRVGLFAIKDIQPNTELTFNYNLEAVGAHKKVCQCGAQTCSGFIGALKTEGKKTKSMINVNKRKKVVKSKKLNKATTAKDRKPVETNDIPAKRLHVTGEDLQEV